MAIILGCFLYSSIALEIGWGTLSAIGLKSLNSGNLRFPTALENKKFRSSALSLPSIILLSSTRVISLLDLICQKVMVW